MATVEVADWQAWWDGTTWVERERPPEVKPPTKPAFGSFIAWYDPKCPVSRGFKPSEARHIARALTESAQRRTPSSMPPGNTRDTTPKARPRERTGSPDAQRLEPRRTPTT